MTRTRSSVLVSMLTRPKIAKKYPIPPGDRQAFLELLRTEAGRRVA